jgi:serine/threonine protein kinase
VALPTNQGELNPLQGTKAGATVQLGADYLSYARERHDAGTFKQKLVEKLLPTVPRRGKIRPVRPGQRFGKFDILEPLGKGGMAFVYRAHDPERIPAAGAPQGLGGVSPEVAIKVMKSEIALDPDYVGRFLREAANTALIDHPNVVSVLEVGSVEGRLYFTMELIEGVTLKEHLRQGPVMEEEGVQILCQVFDGLVAAHKKGVAHRDLKPANVMILTTESRYGFSIAGEFDVHLKITDFGLAHQLSLDQSAVGEGKRFLGTAKYIPPEVALGEDATLKSDVFSLGILAFSMFAGEPPFRARTKMDYITANVEQEAPLLTDKVPVSSEISALVDRMLEKDPAGRPDAEAVGRDLRRLIKRKGRAPIQVDDDTESTFYHLRRASRVDEEKESASERIAAVLPENVDAEAVRASLPWFAGGAGVLVLLLGLLFLRGNKDVDPSPTPSLDPTPTRSKPKPTRSKAPRVPSVDRTQPPSEPLALPVKLPPSKAFKDRLARGEFPRLMRDGDAAWRKSDPQTALEAWRSAKAGLAGRAPQPLVDRLHAAAHAIYLERGRSQMAKGELENALAMISAGLALAPKDKELSRLHQELERAVGDLRAVEEGLKKARVIAFSPERRGEAIQLLEGLRDAAARVDRTREVEAALTKLREGE